MKTKQRSGHYKVRLFQPIFEGKYTRQESDKFLSQSGVLVSIRPVKYQKKGSPEKVLLLENGQGGRVSGIFRSRFSDRQWVFNVDTPQGRINYVIDPLDADTFTVQQTGGDK